MATLYLLDIGIINDLRTSSNDIGNWSKYCQRLLVFRNKIHNLFLEPHRKWKSIEGYQLIFLPKLSSDVFSLCMPWKLFPYVWIYRQGWGRLAREEAGRGWPTSATGDPPFVEQSEYDGLPFDHQSIIFLNNGCFYTQYSVPTFAWQQRLLFGRTLQMTLYWCCCKQQPN